MLLSARMLAQVCDVNTFNYANQVEWTSGDTVRVYFQLLDMSQDKAQQGFKLAGKRYMPAAVVPAVLSVTIDNIDDAIKITRYAVQAFPTSDPSIWYVPVVGTDTISGCCALRLSLNENGVVTKGFLEAAVHIDGASAL